VRPDGVAVVRAADVAIELIAGRDDADRPLDTDALAEVVRSATAPFTSSFD
jgi:hypothetical protein